MTMTPLDAIRAVVAGRPNEKLPAHEIYAVLDLTSSQFQVYARRLVERNLMERTKLPGLPLFRYYMTPEQLAVFASGRADTNRNGGYPKRRAPAPAPISPDADTFGVITDTNDIPGRLSFLEHIKEKTILGQHATLDLIISDYRRTLKMRRAAVQRVEDEAARPGRKRVPA